MSRNSVWRLELVIRNVCSPDGMSVWICNYAVKSPDKVSTVVSLIVLSGYHSNVNRLWHISATFISWVLTAVWSKNTQNPPSRWSRSGRPGSQKQAVGPPESHSCSKLASLCCPMQKTLELPPAWLAAPRHNNAHVYLLVVSDLRILF